MFLTALSYFVVYKIIIAKLGINFMGVWALILGYTSILSQSVSSINTNLIRKIAGFSNIEFTDKVSTLIINALFIYLFFFLLLLAVVLLALTFLMPSVFFKLVGYKVVGVLILGNFIGLLTTILSSSLDGKNLFYIKNSLTIIALTVAFIFFISSINYIGIWSVALMSLIQSVLSFILIYTYVKKKYNLKFRFSFLSMQHCKELLNDSWKLQLISLTVLCYEPIIKYFLSIYGISYVAIYEISNKIIFQIKNLFSIANQTLVPQIVELHKKEVIKFSEFYYATKQKTVEYALFLFSISILLLPIISIFFLKSTSKEFYYIFCIISVGNLLNTLAIPSHISFVSINKINTPLLSFIAILFFLIVFCPLFGYYFNGIGVIIASALALLLGSLVTIIYFEHLYKKNNNTKQFSVDYLGIIIYLSSIILICNFRLTNYYIIFIYIGLFICVVSNLIFRLKLNPRPTI